MFRVAEEISMSVSRIRPRCWLAAVVLIFAAFCGWPLPVAAQTASSALVGRVVDRQGAPLPGVTITATNQETGLVRTTVSESDGAFRLPSLPVGVYKVAAELEGFAT